MFNGAVRRTSELDRILALPRRVPDLAQLKVLAEEMTDLLKTPEGTWTLREAQALSLHDAGICNGAFIPLEVGGGKTISSLMATYVMDAKRPLLLQPASLLRKTEIDRKRLSEHFLIPNHVRLFSYEMLGRVQASEELNAYKPDLIIADEAHKLKNKKAAVTRRVMRWMREYPETKFVALSGTMMRKSLHDFAHILRWCLKENAPVPKTEHELDEWASALDENVSELNRYEPGALFSFCAPGEEKSIENARRGFKRRLVETPGVVATIGEGEHIESSLYVRALQYKVRPITNEHFLKLRSTMFTPDDWKLMQATEVWMHAKQLALGFHSIWSPRPPDEWRNARRNWHSFVREVLSHSRTLDSPLQVANACDAGKLDNSLLEAWRAVEGMYTIKTDAIWHDDSALNVCLEWMKEPGLVWTEHVQFAERLSELSGCKYFGAKGMSADKQFIQDADNSKAIIVSIDANREGKNLQDKWSRNLVTSPPEGGDWWQQMIGRTHRTGQMADTVEIDVLLGCAEHARAWRSALSSSTTVKDTMGAQAKLLIADVDWPSDAEIETYTGARWA